MRDPLAGLDDVPWATLHHAYGAATDTPALLRRVAMHDADDEVWEGLFSSLAHRGTSTQASAGRARSLIALTLSWAGPGPAAVLGRFECIAAEARTTRRPLRAASTRRRKASRATSSCSPTPSP